MKRNLLLFTLLVLSFAACKKTEVDPSAYYVQSFTYFHQGVGNITRTFEYDANKRMVAENVTGMLDPNQVINYRYDYEYGPDGKIKTAWRAAVKDHEYTRDSQGRLILVTRYDAGNTVILKEQYEYFNDRYEFKMINFNGSVITTHKFFYSANGKNIIRMETFDEFGQPINTTNYRIYPEKSAYKLIDDYFGSFTSENLIFTEALPLEIQEREAGYASKLRSVNNGVVVVSNYFELIQ